MALLTITALDDGGQPVEGINVVCYLSDLYSNHLREFTADGLLVKDLKDATDITGVVVFDLPPNSTVLRDNTYYTVQVGQRDPVVIEKGVGPQSLLESLAVSPEALGAAATFDSLADVNLSGLTDGNAIRYSGGMWIPWAWPSGGGGGGATDKPWVSLSVDTVLGVSDNENRYKVDASAAPRSITLPTALGNNGIDFTIKRVNTNSNLVTVQTSLSQGIDGASTYLLDMPFESVTVSSDNANWMVI